MQHCTTLRHAYAAPRTSHCRRVSTHSFRKVNVPRRLVSGAEGAQTSATTCTRLII
jgi:hypothetical protein